MRKQLRFTIAAFVLIVGIITAGFQYYSFVSKTIYTESVSHLAEIFRQTNSSLTVLVKQNWTNLHMWEDYLQDISDENEIQDYVARLKEKTGFNDFYFISAKSGDYMTVNGKTGYLDLKGSVSEQFVQGEVTRQIRRLGDDTPIIILTAYDWSDIEEEARNAGVTAFCSKPS